MFKLDFTNFNCRIKQFRSQVKNNRLNLKNKFGQIAIEYYLIPSILLIIFIILLKLPLYLHFIPDCFKLGEYKDIYTLFDNIASSFTEIIGTAVAFVLVAFEFFRQRIGNYGFNYFIKNKSLSWLICLSVMTIFFAFISRIIIIPKVNVNLNSNQISIVYFNILLFITTLLCFFPLAFKIISSFKIENIIKFEKDRISYCSSTHIHGNDIYEEVIHLTNDPVNVLRGISLSYLHQSDRYIPQLINSAITYKFIDLILGERDKYHSESLDRLLKYYKSIVIESVKTSNSNAIVINITHCCLKINEVFAENKNQISVLNPLNVDFFEWLTVYLLKNNHTDSIKELFDIRVSIFNLHLEKNSPDESNINDLFYVYREEFEKKYAEPQHDPVVYSQWMELSDKMLNSMLKSLDYCIEYKSKDSFEKILINLHMIPTVYLDNIGVFKEAFISFSIHSSIYNSAKKAMREGLIKETIVFGSASHYLDIILRKKNFHAQRIVYLYCEWVIFLCREGFLDNFVLNNDYFYSDIVKIAKRSHDNFEINCFRVCIDAHKFIRMELEKDLEKNKSYYKQLKDGLLLIKKEIGDNDSSKEYIKMIDLELKQFTNEHSMSYKYKSIGKGVRKRPFRSSFLY